MSQNNKDNIQQQIIPVQYIPYPQEEDEIDLRELLKTILNHKKFIIFFTLFVTLLAVIYALVKTPVWEIKANLQMGYYQDNKQKIINPISLKTYIQTTYDDKKQLPKITTSFLKGTKDIIQLSIDEYSNQKAQNYLQKILRDINRKERAKIEPFIKNIKDQIAILKNFNNKLTKQMKSINANLNTTDPQIYQATINAIQNIQNSIIQNSIKIANLQATISPSNILFTSILGKIDKKDYPIKPKKKLIVTVAFITGLILSIFLLFFMEFMRSFKEEK